MKFILKHWKQVLLLVALAFNLLACEPQREMSAQEWAQRQLVITANGNIVNIADVTKVTVCYNADSNAGVIFETVSEGTDANKLDTEGFVIVGDNLKVSKKDTSGQITNPTNPNDTLTSIVIYHSGGDGNIKDGQASGLYSAPENKLRIHVETDRVERKIVSVWQESYTYISYNFEPEPDVCYIFESSK